MNKKFYLATLAMLLLYGLNAQAQCTGGRYWDYIFPSSMSTVTYTTTNTTLQMDIYQPTGDASVDRPLIILAHGGSFYAGNKSDDLTVDSLCSRFARRGYVTASIDYRLMNVVNLLDSALVVDEVVKAIGDGKSAIRFFMKDAVTTNTYKIDTNNIFVGGNSAGAVLYMHVGYVTDSTEYPDYIDSAMAHNGGFEGNSGNTGYPTKLKAVINLAGALNMTSFVDAGDVPSVNAQGDNDNTVPYNCAYPLGGSVHVNLCGLGALEPVYAAKGINHMSMVFAGDAHVPWAGNPAKLNSVDSLVKVFLFGFVCPGVTAGVHGADLNTDVTLYPNPANDRLSISSAAQISEVAVYDQTGRTVYTATNINKESFELNTSRYTSGVYFLKMKFTNDDNAPVVRRIVVE